MDWYLVIEIGLGLFVFFCLVMVWIHLTHDRRKKATQTDQQNAPPGSLEHMIEQPPRSVRRKKGKIYEVTILGSTIKNGCMSARLQEGRVVFEGDKKDIAFMRSLVYRYHIEEERRAEVTDPLVHGFDTQDLWPTAGSRYLEAIYAALCDKESCTPESWITVDRRHKHVA